MIHIHLWLCGRWVWRWVTLAQFNALPHLTQRMIAIRVAKAALGGTLIACAGGGALVIPRIVGGGPSVDLSPIAQPVPEPGTLAVFGVGLVGLWLVKTVKRKPI